MFNEQHELTKDFPEHKDAIHRLKGSDKHFAKLYEEYHVVARELYRIEQEIETPGDEHVEALKKKRAHLKDELFEMIRKKAG